MKISAPRLLYSIALLAAATCFATPDASAQTGARWETVAAASTASAADPGDSDKIDVTTRDGYIYLTSPKAISVKVFTILGQPIAQASLRAGTSRLKVNARGIYILKAGSVTLRVTI